MRSDGTLGCSNKNFIAEDVDSCLRSLAKISAVSRSSSEPSTSYSGGSNLVFDLSSEVDKKEQRPRIGRLLVRRPVAAVALLPQPLVLFGAGACAGALGNLFHDLQHSSGIKCINTVE